MVNVALKFLSICRTGFAIGILLSLLIYWGCGGKKIYKPPENQNNTRIVLINPIYEPGFYVEVDDQEAGFLREKLEINVTPGKHKLKIFNTETEVAEKAKTVSHKFDLKVELGEQEVKEISLNWDDPNYSRDTRKETIKFGEKKKERSTEKPGLTLPGGI